MAEVTAVSKRIIGNIEKVVIGKRQEIILALVAYLSEGHILLEDVPGVAKTMLARALASSVGASFKRVQCTPDLLPTDITGASIFNPKTTEFTFRPGPIFAQIFLADEINRATPRTQAALLEAMAERRVSVDGTTFNLAPPFLVIATQNPVDHEGTFPLPEAQLDRFALRLTIGYPGEDEEIAIARRFESSDPLKNLDSVVTREDLLRAIEICQRVRVGDAVGRYLVALVRATREVEVIALGASPRATLTLWRSAQVRAALDGRPYVIPDDVKSVAASVLCHRLILRPEERARGRTTKGVVDGLLERMPVPVETTE